MQTPPQTPPAFHPRPSPQTLLPSRRTRSVQLQQGYRRSSTREAEAHPLNRVRVVPPFVGRIGRLPRTGVELYSQEILAALEGYFVDLRAPTEPPKTNDIEHHYHETIFRIWRDGYDVIRVDPRFVRFF